MLIKKTADRRSGGASVASELQQLVEFLTGSRSASATMPWHLLSREDIQVIRSWAAETQHPAAQQRMLRSLKNTLRCQAPEEPEVDAMLRGISSCLKPLVRRHRPPTALASRAAKLILQVCRDDPAVAASRDLALLSLMLLAGLGRQEVVRLQLSDYDPEEGSLQVRPPRGTLRVVYLREDCRANLEDWLFTRAETAGPLFLALSARGEIRSRGLSPSGVNLILRRRCRQAGIEGVTPRDLRGRFFRELRSAGGSAESGLVCRYYLNDAGQRGWALASLPGT